MSSEFSQVITHALFHNSDVAGLPYGLRYLLPEIAALAMGVVVVFMIWRNVRKAANKS